MNSTTNNEPDPPPRPLPFNSPRTPFVESLSKCPKHGLHNPFKAPERYLMYGDISTKAAHMLSLPKVVDFFTRLIQRVAPKSYQQAYGEVYETQKVSREFLW